MKPSWLVLERYALGECTADEARMVEATFVSDSDARAILAAIQGDQRALPPLPEPLPRRQRTLLAAGGALLLAALVLLALELREDGSAGAIKGGSVALELVRLQDGLTTSAAEVAVGDRLGLRLTCPPGPTEVDVVVFHGGEAAFPIESTTLSCGNRVPLPGAFSVDGEGPLVACVTLGKLPSRELLAGDPRAADVCIEVAVHW